MLKSSPGWTHLGEAKLQKLLEGQTPCIRESLMHTGWSARGLMYTSSRGKKPSDGSMGGTPSSWNAWRGGQQQTRVEGRPRRKEHSSWLPWLFIHGCSGGEPNLRLWLCVFRRSLDYLDNAVDSVLIVSVSYMNTMGLAPFCGLHRYNFI